MNITSGKDEMFAPKQNQTKVITRMSNTPGFNEKVLIKKKTESHKAYTLLEYQNRPKRSAILKNSF